MKEKKFFAVIITLLFVLMLTVGCTYNQAAPAITTNPIPAAAEQPQETTVSEVYEAPDPKESDQDEKLGVVYISASKLKVRES
ncbi:MAG TPA: hypothetical protein P5510_05040, partial [Clostridia bacterium]|nr:hypothetical protein [Clostridia bacterium]